MTNARKAASNAEVESAAVSADAIAVLLSENTDIEDSSYVAVQIASLIEAGLAATLDQQVKHMVERFLRWRLPENFNPDCGITFKAIYNEHSPFGPSKAEPVGTNLFDYIQAEAMVRHMLAGLPVAAPPVEGWRPTQAATDVLAERRRQVEVEGWTAKHDDRFRQGELPRAATAYSLWETKSPLPYMIKPFWPWDEDWFKPTNHRRNLVKAGALILAEIERLDRLPTPPDSQGGEDA